MAGEVDQRRELAREEAEGSTTYSFCSCRRRATLIARNSSRISWLLSSMVLSNWKRIFLYLRLRVPARQPSCITALGSVYVPPGPLDAFLVNVCAILRLRYRGLHFVWRSSSLGRHNGSVVEVMSLFLGVLGFRRSRCPARSAARMTARGVERPKRYEFLPERATFTLAITATDLCASIP